MKRGLFTNKNFILLAQGQGVSNIGNAVHNTAVAWYILQTVDKSCSGLVLSLYAICILVPIIISGPFAGIYVDRLNRKTILLYSDIINGILFIALSLLTYINFFPLISLFIMVLTSFVVIPLYSIFQKNIPNEFLGRFFAIYYTCVLSATPVGSLIFGSLSDIFPEYSIVLCIGVFLLIITIIVLKFKKLKDLYLNI